MSEVTEASSKMIALIKKIRDVEIECDALYNEAAELMNSMTPEDVAYVDNFVEEADKNERQH